MAVEGDVAVLGDADPQDVRGIRREFPGDLVAHAAAQVVLVRQETYEQLRPDCLADLLLVAETPLF